MIRFSPALSAAIVPMIFASAAWAFTDAVPTLRALARDAAVAVIARQTAMEERDSGRLVLHHLAVERVLLGELPQRDIVVADVVGSLRHERLADEGSRAVVLLGRSPALSYLAHQLPESDYWTIVGARNGVAAISSDEEASDLAHVLSSGCSVDEPAPCDPAEMRALVFRELSSASVRLVADGVRDLTALERIEPLVHEEAEIVRATLSSSTVPTSIRAALVDALARGGVTSAVAVLAALTGRDTTLLDALLQARAALGAPPSREEIAGFLRAGDVVERAAAVAALRHASGTEVLEATMAYALDDREAPAVRLAAARALGASAQPEALALLQRVFDADEPALMREAARAILANEGGDEALATLALQGSTARIRSYAAMLLVTRRGHADPSVRRVAEGSPPPEVKRVLEEGLVLIDAHRH